MIFAGKDDEIFMATLVAGIVRPLCIAWIPKHQSQAPDSKVSDETTHVSNHTTGHASTAASKHHD